MGVEQDRDQSDKNSNTFTSEGREYTVIDNTSYKIPIALPTGIANILDKISAGSVTTYAERKARSQKYFLKPEEIEKRKRDEEAKAEEKLQEDPFYQLLSTLD